MYETFYGFDRGGFQLAQDHRLRFSHDGYTAAFGTLLEATRQREGFVVLTGAVGTGKTTLIDDLAARLEKDGCLLGKLSNCRVDADELPRLVGFAFGLKAENIGKTRLLIELKEHLVGRNSRGQAVILMIDEAQDLSVEALEELHLLFDLIAGQGRTVHILLAGQERLRERLRKPDCEQIQQLVVASCKLTPLSSFSETHAYVAHELRHMGWRGDPEISADALRLIHERTGGIPRLINLSMGHLLLHGSLDEVHTLEPRDVESVMEQIGEDHPELLLDTSQQPSLPQPASSQPPPPLDAGAAEDTGPRKPPLPERVLMWINGRKFNSATQALTDWLQPVTGWDWKWALAGLSAVTICVYMTFVISFDGDPSVPSGAREQNPREQTRIAAATGADRSARKRAETPIEPNASTASVDAYREVFELPTGVDDTEDLEPDLVEKTPATVRSELATDVRKTPRGDTLITGKSAEVTESASPSGARSQGQNQQGQANHKVSKLLAKAERALSKNKLTVPSGDNAYAYYRTVLARDPNNALARAGLRRIVNRYRQLAQQRLSKGDVRSASLFASRGLKIRPRDRQLLAIKRRAAEPQVANQEREFPEILKRFGKWFRSGDTSKSAFLDQ